MEKVELKIDYAIISNNQNVEYTGLFPYIRDRWNSLGIKTIYINCFEDESITDLKDTDLEPVPDEKGNLHIDYPYKPLGKDRLLDKWFEIMISRFWVAGLDQFLNKTLVISDGDLYPINRLAVTCPSVILDHNKFKSYIDNGYLVTTCLYPFGDSLATYTYGKGSTFSKVLPYARISEVYKDAEQYVRSTARMYANDEYYINHKYRQASDKLAISGVIQLRNRLWREGFQQMNNLYHYQIPLLKTWEDLCPFVELHGMRLSDMRGKHWSHLLSLLEEYDKHQITPPNYFYESIKREDLWKDTIITKQGLLIPGDEYGIENGKLKMLY